MSKKKIEELRQELNRLFDIKASYVDILRVSHELDKYILKEQRKLEKERKNEKEDKLD